MSEELTHFAVSLLTVELKTGVTSISLDGYRKQSKSILAMTLSIKYQVTYS